MKQASYLVIIIILFLSSCSATRKQLRNSGHLQETAVADAAESNYMETTAPIKEIEERVVSVTGAGSDQHRYYVIIGSFRYIENARKRQATILSDAFTSELLKNESGLYRVSVLSTDDITAARDDIRRIRTFFPAYGDTWLLIQKK